MRYQMILAVLFAIMAPIITDSLNELEEDQHSLMTEEHHERYKRSRRRMYVIRCCKNVACYGPSKKNKKPIDRVTRPPKFNDTETYDYDYGNFTIGDGGGASPPFACAQINFASLANCCQIHPSIFDFMDPDIRTCTNRTTTISDFPYYKSIVTDYMLNQAVTMKNKLDLRRIPNAVRFYDCFFKERVWIGQANNGEVFNSDMIDEFIDNVDSSWDELLYDAITNCTKVIKNLVPYPFMQLPMKDDPSAKETYQTYPILITQCMRKILLSYCPSPNRPVLSAQCNDMRAKFHVCDPFQQTADPPEDTEDETDEEDENEDDSTPISNVDDTEYTDEPGDEEEDTGGEGENGNSDTYY